MRARAEQAAGIAGLLEAAKAKFAYFAGQGLRRSLKRTKRVWLMTAGIIIGVAALVNLTARAAEWAKNARERRQLHAIATLTPENLFARCGAAVADRDQGSVSGRDEDADLSAPRRR